MKKLTKDEFIKNVLAECEKRNYVLKLYIFDEENLSKSFLRLYCKTHKIEFDKKYASFMAGHDCPKCGQDKRTGWTKDKCIEKLKECIIIEEFEVKHKGAFKSMIRNNWTEEFEKIIKDRT